MSLFQEYRTYLKNNPEGYWFKRKLYGWGWTPVKWQGWLVLAIFILFIFWNATTMTSNQAPTDSEEFWFFTKIIVSVAILIFICYKKGEKPKWQWGLSKGDLNTNQKNGTQ